MGKTKYIREAVEAELNFDPLVDPAGVTVRNLNGQVALNGTVPSYPQYLAAATAAQRAAATSAVAGLTGVRNIRNEVAVWGDADASDVTVHVQDALVGYRIVNYWLPLIPGTIAYIRLRLSPSTAGRKE